MCISGSKCIFSLLVISKILLPYIINVWSYICTAVCIVLIIVSKFINGNRDRNNKEYDMEDKRKSRGNSQVFNSEEQVTITDGMQDMFDKGNINQGTNYAENASFDAFGLGYFMSDGEGSEYLNKYMELVKEKIPNKIDRKGTNFNINMFKLDNQTPSFIELSYSLVILTIQADNHDQIFYHIVLLEATGDKPLTAGMIIDDINQKNDNKVFVASDAFNTVLKDTVLSVLQNEFNVDIDKFVSTNGIVIPADIDVEEAAVKSMKLAINTNMAEIANDTGLVQMIDLRGLAGSMSNHYLQLDINTNTTNINNAIGRVVRADFQIELNKVSKSNKVRFMNTNSSRMSLSTTYGYLDYLPKEDQPQFIGQPGRKSIMPAVILTEQYSIKPNIDMMLMNIINAAILGQQQHLAGLLINNKRDVGVLNYYVNFENNKTGFGEKIKIKDGSLQQHDVLEIISKIFDFSPIVYIETEAYGVNFNTSSPFMGLHYASVNPEIARNSNEMILDVAETMTGTKFQNRRVSGDEGIVVPLGHWIDGHGVKRDVREVDLAYVIENTKDAMLINKWVQSNLPASFNNNNAYLLKIEVMNAILPNSPVINGKAYRVPLNSGFVSELVSYAMGCGYSPTVDAGVNMSNGMFNDLQSVANAYADAGLKGINFGTTANYGQGGFNTPETNLFSF